MEYKIPLMPLKWCSTFCSSDRTIMDYARDIWDIKECLPKDYINENK